MTDFLQNGLLPKFVNFHHHKIANSIDAGGESRREICVEIVKTLHVQIFPLGATETNGIVSVKKEFNSLILKDLEIMP